MTEKEMEDLLWCYSDDLLHEPLKQFQRQPRSQVGIADLVFEDPYRRLLIVEVKKGKMPRGAINQLVDYRGMLKTKFPSRSIEMMVIANSIPQERRVACEQFDIECREISEKKFRAVAKTVGYRFNSEEGQAKGNTAARLSTGKDAELRVKVTEPNTEMGIGKARESLGADWTVRDLAGALKIHRTNAQRRLKGLLTSGVAEKLSDGKRGRTGTLARYQFKPGQLPHHNTNAPSIFAMGAPEQVRALLDVHKRRIRETRISNNLCPELRHLRDAFLQYGLTDRSEANRKFFDKWLTHPAVEMGWTPAGGWSSERISDLYADLDGVQV